MLPTEDLLRIVLTDSNEYENEVVEIAKIELDQRGIDINSLESDGIRTLLFGEKYRADSREEPPFWFGRPYTKDDLEDAHKRKKLGLRGKWNIKQHLESDRSYYTTEARQYLIEIAKQEGLSETEISQIIRKGEEKRKMQDTWKETLLKFTAVGVVLALCIFVLPAIFNINMKMGIFSSMGLTIAIVLFMWKRGW